MLLRAYAVRLQGLESYGVRGKLPLADFTQLFGTRVQYRSFFIPENCLSKRRKEA